MAGDAEFKGSRAEWFEQNGWRATVLASGGGFELREYSEQTPTQWHVVAAREVIRSSARIHPSTRGGWVFDFGGDMIGQRVERFDTVEAAFAWWVEHADKTVDA